MKDDDLDTLFAAARAAPPVPSDALLARVLADAAAHQPAPRPVVARPLSIAPRGGVWHRLADLFGGAGALAGMGGAAVAGLVLGYVQPDGLSALSDAMLGGALDSVALMPSVDPLFAEVTP